MQSCIAYSVWFAFLYFFLLQICEKAIVFKLFFQKIRAKSANLDLKSLIQKSRRDSSPHCSILDQSNDNQICQIEDFSTNNGDCENVIEQSIQIVQVQEGKFAKICLKGCEIFVSLTLLVAKSSNLRLVEITLTKFRFYKNENLIESKIQNFVQTLNKYIKESSPDFIFLFEYEKLSMIEQLILAEILFRSFSRELFLIQVVLPFNCNSKAQFFLRKKSTDLFRKFLVFAKKEEIDKINSKKSIIKKEIELMGCGELYKQLVEMCDENQNIIKNLLVIEK